MNWLRKLKAQVRFKEPLSKHTTLKVGGPADAWVRPVNFKLLQEITTTCLKKKIPYLVIGKGSNILFSDQGFRGVVISLDSPFFSGVHVRGEAVSCGAATPLAMLMRQMQENSLGGLEFLAGVPATLAGAIIMNAGAHNEAIGSLVQSVTVMDKKGKKQILPKRKLKFDYRKSNLKKYIVLEMTLKLNKRNPKKIKENTHVHLTQKRKTQDLNARSAGCIFRNPETGLSAGAMIEACGLKGAESGGAQISVKHANYIINRNKAAASDVLYLIKLAQRKVKQKFRINLKPEIEIVK